MAGSSSWQPQVRSKRRRCPRHSGPRRADAARPSGAAPIRPAMGSAAGPDSACPVAVAGLGSARKQGRASSEPACERRSARRPRRKVWRAGSGRARAGGAPEAARCASVEASADARPRPALPGRRPSCCPAVTGWRSAGPDPPPHGAGMRISSSRPERIEAVARALDARRGRPGAARCVSRASRGGSPIRGPVSGRANEGPLAAPVNPGRSGPGRDRRCCGRCRGGGRSR